MGIAPLRLGSRYAGIVLGIWLSGVLLFGLTFFASLRGAQRLARRAFPVDDEVWRQLLLTCKRKIGLNRHISLLISEEVAIPMTQGIWKPAILLPPESKEWGNGQMMAVLLHELAHIKRHDYFLQNCGRVARLVYWCNPLAWWIHRSLVADQEIACDEEVLRSGIERSDYARLLLDLAGDMVPGGWHRSAVVAMARPASLETRITSILTTIKPRKELTMRTNLIIACFVVALVTLLTAMHPIVFAENAPASASAETLAPAAQPPQEESADEITTVIVSSESDGDDTAAVKEKKECVMKKVIVTPGGIAVGPEMQIVTGTPGSVVMYKDSEGGSRESLEKLRANLEEVRHELESTQLDRKKLQAKMDAIIGKLNETLAAREKRLAAIEKSLSCQTGSKVFDEETLKEIERKLQTLDRKNLDVDAILGKLKDLPHLNVLEEDGSGHRAVIVLKKDSSDSAGLEEESGDDLSSLQIDGADCITVLDGTASRITTITYGCRGELSKSQLEKMEVAREKLAHALAPTHLVTTLTSDGCKVLSIQPQEKAVIDEEGIKAVDSSVDAFVKELKSIRGETKAKIELRKIVIEGKKTKDEERKDIAQRE